MLMSLWHIYIHKLGDEKKVEVLDFGIQGIRTCLRLFMFSSVICCSYSIPDFRRANASGTF